MKKKLPIDIEDFKELIEGNYYYVDKTDFIHEILEKRVAVELIARPKKFGKTLNLSALRYFLDKKDAEYNKNLFTGLKVEKSRNMSEQGKYPVIYISMKNMPVETYDEFLEEMKKRIRDLYKEHIYIRESLDECRRMKFNKILLDEEKAFYKWALMDLSILLEKYYGEKAVILIDEYDAPMLDAFGKESLENIKSFLMSLYGSGLKDSPCAFAVITGTTRIIMDQVDNLAASTIFDKNLKHFGISEKELEEILKEYNLIENLEEVKKYYSGYIISRESVYNPLEIFRYCSAPRIGDMYDTGLESLLKSLIKKELELDLHGFAIRDFKSFCEEFKITWEESVILIIEKNNYWFSKIFTLLIGAGYLSINPKKSKNEDWNIREFIATNEKTKKDLLKIFY
ncbi:AAA family ATPase [Candidatus Cetobacterium colombiensis]|uniref:AAA family ATPase n=1 Tax=Candidatus Cetobacterium colombiensis TaxID=3073100 RepID=A0ABU4W5W8_9FUSO|nr:AAA family ATPase [Candidatus Cetobacterium colombiensis]MDX8334923.1 AAA family ATPase [Candidatus Cetobacterium colombiensis]